jgi:hypothetical protein
MSTFSFNNKWCHPISISILHDSVTLITLKLYFFFHFILEQITNGLYKSTAD